MLKKLPNSVKTNITTLKSASNKGLTKLTEVVINQLVNLELTLS